MSNISREFVFTECVSLYPNLQLILDFIKPYVSEEIASRSKLIVVEFLTNIIKHTCGFNNKISIEIGERSLSIIKSDAGSPFSLRQDDGLPSLKWPLQDISQQSLVIYQDELCILKGILKSRSEIEFVTEDLPVDAINNHNDLLEHYGLIILTKYSDKFTYTYDEKSGLNYFESVTYLPPDR